jgi:uncharacterized protein YodC (DUF2158 family)
MHRDRSRRDKAGRVRSKVRVGILDSLKELKAMKAGDLVRLKSGSPLMTVEAVEPSGVICTWFDEKKNLKQQRFLEVTLELDEPGEGGTITIS